MRATNGIETDVVAESTAAAGVTVDGVLLKDSDVYPLSDNRGMFNRSPGQFATHFSDNVSYISPPSPWAWASYLSGAPTTANTTTVPSVLWVQSDNNTKIHFLYKTSVNPATQVLARVRVDNITLIRAGVRIDDGTAGTNYFECYVEQNAAGVFRIKASVGGTTTTYYAGLIRAEWVTVGIRASDGRFYAAFDDLSFIALLQLSGAPAWTPTNFGLVIAGSDISRTAFFDGVTI